MGFLTDLFASMGFGGAKIDTRLTVREAAIGGRITGEVHVYGGKIPQHIGHITVQLMTQAEREVEDRTYYVTLPIQRVRVMDSFTIHAGEHKVIPFEIKVPFHTPISYGKVQTWVATELDIKGGMDAGDRDHVKIVGHDSQLAALSSIDRMGFAFRTSDCEYSHHSHTSYVQEFEYYPSSEFRKYLDELEVSFELSHHELVVKLTIDRKVRGLGGLFNEMAGTDDRKVKVRFTHEEIKHNPRIMEDRIRETIHAYKR